MANGDSTKNGKNGSKNGSKGGRPTKYTDDFPKRAYRLALLGLIDTDIALALGIQTETFYIFRKQHPEFAEALKKGKSEADGYVAESLYRRALGYSHPEDKVFVYKGSPVVVPTEKHHPPDTTAAIFWLKNRQRDKWRDVWNLEHTGKNGAPIQMNHNIDLSDCTDAELELMERIGMKVAGKQEKSDSPENEEDK